MVNFQLETAKKIKEYLKQKKVMLYSKQENIFGQSQKIYFYNTKDDRDKHVKEMKDKGYEYYEDQNLKESIHVNLYNQEENIYVYKAFFTKQSKNNDFWKWLSKEKIDNMEEK